MHKTREWVYFYDAVFSSSAPAKEFAEAFKTFLTVPGSCCGRSAKVGGWLGRKDDYKCEETIRKLAEEFAGRILMTGENMALATVHLPCRTSCCLYQLTGT